MLNSPQRTLLLQLQKQWTVLQIQSILPAAVLIPTLRCLLGGGFDLTNHPQSPVCTLSTDQAAVLVISSFSLILSMKNLNTITLSIELDSLI